MTIQAQSVYMEPVGRQQTKKPPSGGMCNHYPTRDQQSPSRKEDCASCLGRRQSQ